MIFSYKVKLANMLFGKDSGLEKLIRIEGKEYLVIGILQDTKDVKRIIYRINQENRREGKEKNYYDFPIFVLDNNNNDKFSEAILAFKVNINHENAQKVSNHLSTLNPTQSYNLIYRQNLQEYFNDKKSDNESLFVIMMIALLIIISLQIMTVMLFSIKERVSEIAIRKAVGASEFDISKQFLFETIIQCFIGAIIGVFIGTILSVVIMSFVCRPFGMFFVSLSAITVLLPILVCLLCIILFAVFPALLASKSKVAVALKFD